MDNWANIPSVILLEIMQYLSRRDRLSCGMVCKSWYMAMCSPVLWKNMSICMDTDLTDPLTKVVSRRYAPYISSLDLTWTKPYLPRRWMRNRMAAVAQDMCRFLVMLKECNIELDSLELNDWYFTWKFKKVVYHLTMFLKQQRHLQYINLSNAYLNKSDILKILFACRHSRLVVKYLDLLGSFHEWHNVFTNTNFANALNQFSNLEILKLDYSALSDKTLTAFIDNENKSMKLIEINVKDVDSRSHVISSDTWAKIAKNCRNLQVSLYISNICHYEDIYYILIDSMPLQTFVLNCANIWDQNRSRNFCGTISLLTNNFETTLTHVTLQLKSNREMVDSYLYEMIKRCKQLEYLEFDGVLRTMDLFKDICELRCGENDRDFNFFHVRPRNISVYNNLVISDIWRNYVKKMEEMSFNFEIETFNNPTVRIFC